MISSFDVYLVMQLDALNAFLVIASIVLFFGGLVSGVLRAMNMERFGSEERAVEGPKIWRLTRNLMISGAVSAFAVALLPSSKTAAAMILVPALTSEQVTAPLTAEAKELYALAKSALTNLADKKADPVEAEKEGGK